ncbi:MAG TPA: class I SAM-dependent methyltransferase [Casimicrobiaceae bacterium]|nr:class I SAM-dependent methyltransferase [Casimicrobiaceae bacterium]
MHPTAMLNCRNFFECYGPEFDRGGPVKVIEIGAQDINGSLRQTCPNTFEYIGVDFVAGPGVDVVLSDPYSLPFLDAEADIVLSSSCFEHSEMFWLVFLEVLRVLKPRGLFYLNVPSNGVFHRHPVDCWRFYPDSGNALATWAGRNGIPTMLLESFVCSQLDNGAWWNDFVAVFVKDRSFAPEFPRRIVDTFQHFNNGITNRDGQFLNPAERSEDHRKLAVIDAVVRGEIRTK